MRRRRRPKLYLVGQDPADVFDDLGQLRADLTAPPQRRPRTTETFAWIPHDKGLALYQRKLSCAAWVLLIELDRLILKHHGHNPVKLISARLRAIGLNDHTRTRALRQLEVGGVVRVERRGCGLAPWVTHLWYPLRD
jgi:hypothetical protein